MATVQPELLMTYRQLVRETVEHYVKRARRLRVTHPDLTRAERRTARRSLLLLPRNMKWTYQGLTGELP